MDVMLRNVTIKRDDLEYKVDLGIRRREIDTDDGYHTESSITDIGDLSVFYGYDELDAESYVMMEGKVWEKELNALPTEMEAYDMLRKGYLAVKVKMEDEKVHSLPINVIKPDGKLKSGHSMGSTANFFLEKDGRRDFAIVNGYLINLQMPTEQRIKLKTQ